MYRHQAPVGIKLGKKINMTVVVISYVVDRNNCKVPKVSLCCSLAFLYLMRPLVVTRVYIYCLLDSVHCFELLTQHSWSHGGLVLCGILGKRMGVTLKCINLYLCKSCECSCMIMNPHKMEDVCTSYDNITGGVLTSSPAPQRSSVSDISGL